MEYVILPSRDNSPDSNWGFVKRHPMEVSLTSPGPPQGSEDLPKTQGARVIDSTPPATTTSAALAAIICWAIVIADIPEAQRRLTVIPGTDSGKPAKMPAIRATLRFSSPAPFALP